MPFTPFTKTCLVRSAIQFCVPYYATVTIEEMLPRGALNADFGVFSGDVRAATFTIGWWQPIFYMSSGLR